MGSHAREVVTLQLGHYSNFVGTHWWNIQESSFVYNPAEAEGKKEINHDILFREGQNLSGDITFTPRLIAVDLKGSLNTLKQDGQLYEFPIHQYQDDVLWKEDVTLHKLESTPKNEFLQDLDKLEDGEGAAQDENSSPESDRDESTDRPKAEASPLQKLYDLDNSVTVWSDFLRLHLHPKSIHLLHDFQHKNDLHRYDMFGYGRQMAPQSREWDDLEDRLHFFLEECDQLQGVQVLVDTHDGFGGLGTSMLQHIHDDYGVRNVLLFGLTPPNFTANNPMDHGYRILNSMLAYDELSSSGSAFVPLSTTSDIWRRSSTPLSLPHLEYKPDSWYHTSAILGSSLDTATLPYRVHRNPSLLSHLTDALTAGGRKMLGLQTSLPFPLRQWETLVDAFMALSEDPPWQPITPLYSGHVGPFSQSVVLRGIPNSQIKGPITQSMPRDIQLAKSADDVLEMYLRERYSTSLSASCTVQQATKVSAPFPHIFGPNISRQGTIDSVPRDKATGVESVPMMTSLQASPSTVDLLESLDKEARRLKLKKFTKLLESGVEEDDIEETFNNLETLIQSYKTNTEAVY